MSADQLLFGYVAVLLGTLFLVSLHQETKRRRFGPEQSKDRIFRCGKCGFVYTDDADVELSRCPHCGRSNAAYEF